MLIPSDLRSLARNVYRRKIDDHQRYRLLLMPLMHKSDLQEGYRHLVWLLKEGYLMTIVTLNSDTQFETMLYRAGIKATILEIGKDALPQIVEALDDPPADICIVKLYPNHTTRAQPENTLSSLPDEIFSGLKGYVQKATVIVGSVPQDLSLVQMLKSVDVTNIYYVLPSVPAAEDVINEIKQDLLSIFGSCGEFTLFFAAIVASIRDSQSPSLMPFRSDNMDQPCLNILPERGEPGADSSYEFDMLPEPEALSTEPSYAPTALLEPRELQNDDESVLDKLHNGPVSTRDLQYPSEPVRKRSRIKADVLLATVTAVETQAVLHLFPDYEEITIRQKNYYNLGQINDLKIMLVQQTKMGSNGAGGSHMSTQEAISALSPLYVIMVGIAFGVDANKQNIGDILISQQIQDCDPQRVSLGLDNEPVFESRGDRVMASPQLLGLFRATYYALPSIWPGEPPEIQFGLILSGSKLVDHLAYRDELRRASPGAIGGEMEGIGLYNAAMNFNRRVHWILVKAISDWADGEKNSEKNDRQQIAARNAALFTHQVLQRGGFTKHRLKNKI